MEKVVQSVLRFDGVNDYIDLGQKAEHKIPRDITIEAWIYATKQVGYAGIISRVFDTDSRESGYGLTLDGSSGIYVAFRTAGGPAANFYHSSGPNTLKLNVWTHVATTYDGKKIAIYVNGELKKTVNNAGNINYAPDNSLSIGAYRDDNELRPFPGKIAQVRLWNRVRTQEEIKATMKGALTGKEAGLVGYWPLDEGAGQVGNDKSGKALHGAIKGATWESEELPFVVVEAPKPPAVIDPKLDPRIAELEKKVAELADALTKCGGCEDKLAEQAKKLEDLEDAVKKCAEGEDKLAEQAKKIAALEDAFKKCGGCEDKLTEQANKIAALEDAFKKCAEGEDKLTEQAKKIAALEDAVKKCGCGEDEPPKVADIQITQLSYKGLIKRTEGDEFVEITNRGTAAGDLSGYKLSSQGGLGRHFVFPAGLVLAPGKSIRVYTNKEDSNTGGYSYQSKTAIWNNEGDEGVLADANGKRISSFAYGSKRGQGAITKRAEDKAAKQDKHEPLTANQIWDKVKAAWPGFEFMWQPGASEDELNAAEKRIGAALPQNVRALMAVCSGAGFPAPFSASTSAEVSLLPVREWRPLVDLLSKDMSAEEIEEMFAEEKDLVIIGEDPSGADYGVYVLLRPSTAEVLSFLYNEGTATLTGSFEKWLLEERPGDDPKDPRSIYTAAEEDKVGVDESDRGAEAIAQRHRETLGGVGKQSPTYWDRVEKQFIAAVKLLRAS